MKQKELESEIGKLVEDRKRLEANTIRYDLISRILAGQPEENPHLNDFKQLLENDFLEFANTEASLSTAAGMSIAMREVHRQLEQVANFPIIHRKRVVAVGGGFSSGKSTFLNHIFEDVHLPVGMTPVTAIPTYVLSGSASNIEGVNHHGGKFELSDLYEKLSHDFIDSFPFKLRKMLHAVIIQSPLRSTNFDHDHICFLDTPAYDFGEQSSSLLTDEKVAAEQLRNADALIWMVGLDVNGTISSSDLDFLKGIGNKDLYIILSKAELSRPENIEDILDEVTASLEDYDIDYYGINAYSAHTGQEYSHRKKRLDDFFTETNKQVDTKRNLQVKINKVFEAYDMAIKNDLEKVQKFHSAINNFKLDMLENSGSDDLYKQFSEQIGNLEYPRSEEKLRDDIERLGKLRKNMNKALEEFFDNL